MIHDSEVGSVEAWGWLGWPDCLKSSKIEWYSLGSWKDFWFKSFNPFFGQRMEFKYAKICNNAALLEFPYEL